MMALWKYTKAEYAQALLDHGALRIGTLYDFRSAEHSVMVSDKREGHYKFRAAIDYASAEDVQRNPALSKFVSGELNQLFFDECSFEGEDYFVFSASRCYEPTVHQDWYKTAGYDASYRIESPERFFAEISRQLQSMATFVGWDRVHYYDDQIDLNSVRLKGHTALCKPADIYRDQNEVRAIWQPRNRGRIEPIMLRRSDVARFCAPFASIG